MRYNRSMPQKMCSQPAAAQHTVRDRPASFCVQNKEEMIMSKKRKKSVPTVQPKQEKKLVIDMMKVERAKANHTVGFRTGRHLTEKDRPRKKDWKREYEREKGPGCRADITGSFLLP